MADPQDPWAAFNPQPLPSAAAPAAQSTITLGTPHVKTDPGYIPDPHNPTGEMPMPGGPKDPKANGALDGTILGDPTKHGDDYLSTVPQSYRNTVKLLSDNKMQVSPFALKTPYWQSLIASASQYDPTFDPSLVPVRQKAMRDFSGSGPAANAIGGINRLAANLQQLKSISDQMGGPNTGIVPLNKVVASVEQMGEPKLVAAYDALLPEIATQFDLVVKSNKGSSTVSGIDTAMGGLGRARSQAERDAAFAQVAKAIHGAIAPLKDQWDSAYGGTKAPPMWVSPGAANFFSSLDPENAGDYGGGDWHGLPGLKGDGSPGQNTPQGGNHPQGPTAAAIPGANLPGNGPSGGGNPPTDPSVQNVGGFRDQMAGNPAGAVQFHDALFNAAHAGQIKSVGDAQSWAAAYNKQNGTDFGVADSPLTRQAISAAIAGKPFSVDIPQMSQTEAARMNDRINVTKNNPKADAAIAGGLDSDSVGAFRPLSAAADAAGDFLTGKGFDYTGNLNADTNYLNAVRQGAPGSYLAGQLAGGLMLPSFGARSLPELMKLGAGYGGAYGLNSSAGQPLADKGVNALTGALAGASLPLVLHGAGEVIGGAKNALGFARDALPQGANSFPINPDELAHAGQQEGVTVNRAMVNPALEPKVTAVGKTMIGSRQLQPAMRDIGQQIQGGVDKLGQGGTALEPQAAGDTVAGAGLRYITQTGQQFNRLYGALRNATASVKIPAAQAQLQTEELIKQLSEMPNQNANEISYLQGLKQDLSKPLTIDAMRSLRTKIRQDLASGNLTFGPNEARVQGIADAAAQDISNGLNAAGKGDVANRFQQVDAAYRDRMGMIQGTIQKLIGKRGQNLSGEQVYANLKTMAGPRGNASGLTRMLEQMTPDERADTAATFADALGKNPQGDFSTAYLAKQVNAMPQAMRTAVFGREGAQSLNNLGMLAKAHARVTNKLGGSPTGLANDYRGWLFDTVLGGGTGLLTDNLGKGAAVAATAAGIKAGRDLMNARMLLNPDIQKWLSAAPATASQKAIDVHFNRLNTIAAKNPGIAQDIVHFKQAVLNAANSNAPMGAAAASQDSGPQQQ